MSITTLCHNLRSGEIDLHAYIQETLALIAEREPIIQALLPEPDRLARLQLAADELYSQYPDPNTRPPLFGVLFGVKDLFNVDVLPTQAGSRIPAEAFRGQEAEIVTQLKRLGAIVLGKTVSTEFAYFSPGPTRNPVNPQHTPGGSSSGSAAAVAAGYCPFALGTQTIASIIRPASYCGVYGYKPSYGLISTAGVFPFSQTADHVGIIAESLDTISFISSLLFPWNGQASILPEPSVGFVTGAYLEQAYDEQKANVERTLAQMQARGFHVWHYDLFPDIDLINARHRRLIAAEFTLNHRQLYADYGHLYSEHSRQLYQEGLQVPESDLGVLRNECILLRQRIMKVMSDLHIDFWIIPSTTGTAPRGLGSTGSPLMSLPWTNAGLPSLTIPCGYDGNGLPLGLQLIGAYRDDPDLLLQAARIDDYLSRQTDHHR